MYTDIAMRLKRDHAAWMWCRNRAAANEIAANCFHAAAELDWPDDSWPYPEADSSFYEALDEARKFICSVCPIDEEDRVLELQWTDIAAMFRAAEKEVR